MLNLIFPVVFMPKSSTETIILSGKKENIFYGPSISGAHGGLQEQSSSYRKQMVFFFNAMSKLQNVERTAGQMA